MTTVTPSPPGAMSRREETAFLVFSCWIITGLFLDGWSHNHHKPETFFTPWHGLLYSGFIAATAFAVMEAARQRRLGLERVPVAGEALTVAGTAIFGAAMVGDFIWHSVFGIETGIEALLSPTHLALMTGGLLMATSPLRAALATRPGGAPSLRRFVPVLVSVIMSTALVAFFVQFEAAFRGQVGGWAVTAAGRSGLPELTAIHGVAAILITNALLLSAAAVMIRSWKTPPGTLTLLLGSVALMLLALDGFDRVLTVVAALAAGAVGDALVGAGRPRLALAAMPLVLWPAWFGLLRLTGPMVWSTNLWAGATYLAVLTGVGVAAFGGVSRTTRHHQPGI